MQNRDSQDRPPPRDFRQEVTDDIIRLLQEGHAPWQQPWENVKAWSLPYNPTTNKPYRGGNILALMGAGIKRGYGDPRWMTYKQAAEKDWHVRKGEKAAQVEFWETRPCSTEEDDDEDKKRPHLVHRVYSVFNGQQIDGIPQIHMEPRKPFEVIEAGERILADSGADIRHGGNRAYYVRHGDYIQLPCKEQFIDAPAYYGTGCHELIHWSGNDNRLNRETLTKSRGYSAQDEQYAREELIAEIGSMMLAAETGIPHDPAQHAAYVASWIKALKNDKNEIFRAASAASKAADYVLGLNREPAQSQPKEESHAARAIASRKPREFAL